MLIDVETDQGISGRAYIFCIASNVARVLRRIVMDVLAFFLETPRC